MPSNSAHTERHYVLRSASACLLLSIASLTACCGTNTSPQANMKRSYPAPLHHRHSIQEHKWNGGIIYVWSDGYEYSPSAPINLGFSVPDSFLLDHEEFNIQIHINSNALFVDRILDKSILITKKEFTDDHFIPENKLILLNDITSNIELLTAMKLGKHAISIRMSCASHMFQTDFIVPIEARMTIRR